MRWVWFISGAALVAIGAARAAELSAGEIADARRLYNAKCAKCHKFYDPAKYDAAAWNQWMTKMSKKARLKEAQTELLGRYLGSFRPTAGTNVAASGAAKH